MSDPPQRLSYSVAEVAKQLLGRDPSSVYALCRTGQLRYARQPGGRMFITHRAVMDYLDEQERRTMQSGDHR